MIFGAPVRWNRLRRDRLKKSPPAGAPNSSEGGKKMTGHKKLELPESFKPAVPCDQCLADPTMTRTNGAVVVTYCNHNHAGAILPLRDGKPAANWTIYSPVTLKDWTNFLGRVNENLVELIEQEKREEKDLANLPEDFFYQV